MITLRIYYQDLSEEMQQKILKIFGNNNNNWDCFPIATLEIEDMEDKEKNIVIDSFLGDQGL